MNPSKARLRDPERVFHMLEAARDIEDFLRGKTLANLQNDRQLRFAVERAFEILGEAATHVSSETQQLWPSVDWRETKAFRNLIAHEYFRVDLGKLWHVARNIVPGLRLVLEELFAELNQTFGPNATN